MYDHLVKNDPTSALNQPDTLFYPSKNQTHYRLPGGGGEEDVGRNEENVGDTIGRTFVIAGRPRHY